MTSRDFCFWLQGYFELDNNNRNLTSEQVNTIKRHLSMVFKHEIDPSYGDNDVQEALNNLHYQNGQITNNAHLNTTKIRC